MNFRTALPIPKYPFLFQHDNRILSLGSCFAENIAARLAAHKFTVVPSPFGIIYNPLSIQSGLRKLLDQYEFSTQDLVDRNGYWYSYQHHSAYTAPTADELVEQLHESSTRARDQLQQTNRLIITFGTAWVYERVKTGEVVANCHKLPAAQFVRRRLDVKEICAGFMPLLKDLKIQQPQLEVILTVSPIRHLRDGLIENQRSKAILLLATEAISKALDFVHYFPAYELLLDDLRDYRFYANDLTHPSTLAVDYIWERFESAFFDANTLALNKRIGAVQRAAKHRAFQQKSAGHQHFLRQELKKLDTLQQMYAWLDLEVERAAFMTQLA